MLLFKKQSLSDVTDYTPIAKAAHNLDADAELKVKRKFDITYLIAKHNLAFTWNNYLFMSGQDWYLSGQKQ